MAYKTVYKSSVSRDLKRVGRTDSRRILDKIEKDLAANPGKYPVLKGPFAGLRKFRAGAHRVIFVLLHENVLILRIGHRKEVYR